MPKAKSEKSKSEKSVRGKRTANYNPVAASVKRLSGVSGPQIIIQWRHRLSDCIIKAHRC